MNNWAHYKIPAFALVLYFILYVLFYDRLQYLLDSDAVAYLTIAHRGANADWARSINGLWSSMNSWMLIPFIRYGVDAWTATKGLNVFFGGVLIVQFWALLKQLKCGQFQVAFGTLILVIPVCYFAYFQMFGDVLQLIFALAYLGLVIRKNFMLSTKWVLLAAMLMGLAYYAKAYSLVFFILHFSVLAFMAFFKEKENRKGIILNYILGIGTVVLIALPWAFQLQKKYGEFALTGMAGKLNLSWYMNSGKTFHDSLGLLIPPAHDDSPCFWEDPCLSAGELSTPFSSAYHFKRWVLRVGHTCLMATKSVCEITFFFIPIFLVFFYRLWKRKKITELQTKLVWAIILLPIGYLAMHIETRYIWLLMFLIILLGFYLMEQFSVSTLKKQLYYLLFGLSLIAFPLYKLFDLQDKNKDLFILANELKAQKIKGKIVTDLDDEGDFWVVSYLAGLNNYTIEKDEFDFEEMVREMKRYHIRYFYHFPKKEDSGGLVEQEFDDRFELIFPSKFSNGSLYRLKN